ncbi:hypothetical protein HID58_066483 [Brassica napus]|uniref:Uncharacterized protein n=1 Tax=Brassica napus TaxID=3708 RepID=A0ABQ7ZFS5_BRANA|nr:hypothetical protein HID58_066483 [Brassica napus]
MFPMLTVPLPPRFRPPPDPPSCKSLPLGFLSPLKPSDPPDPPEPPDPPDVTCLWSITAKYVAATRLPPPEIPLLFYPSLCSNFHPTIDSFTLVESILYSAIECSLPITTFYSAIECLLPITSWSTFGLEDCSTNDLFSVLFKGSAFWCYITSAIVASVKIVIHALVAEPITSIRSLIVFFVSHGVIPLFKPSVGEIQGPKLLAGFDIIFVNNSSSNGD